jgi:hypothetical protein
MTTTTPTPDVPLPPGAVMAEWQDLEFPGYAFRYFEGRHWVIEQDWADDAEVYIRGTQNPDGTIDEHHVVVHQLHADDPITAAQAPERGRNGGGPIHVEKCTTDTPLNQGSNAGISPLRFARGFTPALLRRSAWRC